MDDERPTGRKALLVASGGGHLTQLWLLRDRLRPAVRDPLWVTYDIPQARGLLGDQDVVFGHHPTTRNVLNAIRNYRLARRVLRDHDVERVISTGAAIAVPFMLRARQLGIPCHYIESATRVNRPSLSGRLLERVPGVHLYTQYPHWIRRRWYHAGSVYDGFRVRRRDATDVRRILVTLGTQDYPFDALVEQVRGCLKPEDDIVWQLGATLAPDGLPGRVVDALPAGEMDELLATRDAVVGHAGTGLALSALTAGCIPVLAPRRAKRGEHVDDHQLVTARELRDRGLAVVREVDDLAREDLEEAAGLCAERTSATGFPLALGGEEGAAGPLATPAVWRRRLGWRLAMGDALAIGVSTAAAYALRLQLGEVGLVRPFASEVPVALAVLPLWLTILYWTGSYRPEILNSGGDAFRRFSAGVAGGVLALGFVSFLFNLEVSRLFVGLLSVLVFATGGLLRLGTRIWLRTRHRRGELVQNVLLVGTDHEAREVAEALRASERAGYRPVGFLDPEEPIGATVVGDLEVLGTPDDVLEVAYEQRAGLVLVSPTGVPAGTLDRLTAELEGSPIDLAVAPSLFEVVSRRVTVETVANVPILHVDQIRLERGNAAVKRMLDLVVALGLGVLALPLMIAAAIAVRIDTLGPVLFRQRRVGRDGDEFTLYKFRTMVEGADERLREVEHLNEVGHGFFKVREDPRVTRVGRFLRKWSIDELPQLYNVLRGDMSMVGPRPPLPREVDDYAPWQLRRLRVRPGITGVWQVSGRSEVPFDEAVRMDLFYIENWSLGYDLFLLAKTVAAVLGRTGAY